MKVIPSPLNVKCLHPRQIRNPYTNEMLTVPCGHCTACILKKNSRLAFQCDLESLQHKYCMFVTLTYRNSSIPRANFVDSISRPFSYDLFDKETGELLGPCDITEFQKDALLKKFYLFGDVPYLNKEHLQLFLKRFRYYVSTISKEKIRYFAIGEYGPVHFRPHFHLLLWFSDKKILQVFDEFLVKAWPHGLTDSSLSKGQCTSYVASYVNSSVSLPKIFRSSSVKPFCLHSVRLGQGFLKNQREKVYEMSASDFVSQSLVVNQKFRTFRIASSCYTYYFPKCKGYSTRSPREITYSYCIYKEALELYPTCKSAIELARDIAATIVLFGAKLPSDDYPHNYLERTNRLLSYFYDSKSAAPIGSDVHEKYVYNIYKELLVSRHFLLNCCDHEVNKFPRHEEIIRKLRLFEKFYKELDYMNLVEFFESQSQFLESDMCCDDNFDETAYCRYYPLFYDNVYFNENGLREYSFFKIYEQEVFKESLSRIKHKKLNDLNNIFIYD